MKEENSNTPPFPVLLLIEINVLSPFNVSIPAETSINGELCVADSDVHFIIIDSIIRDADDVIEMREILLPSSEVRVIVNEFNICSPSLDESMHPLTLTTVDPGDDPQYACIVSLDETFNCAFNECFPDWSRMMVPFGSVENSDVCVASFNDAHADVFSPHDSAATEEVDET